MPDSNWTARPWHRDWLKDRANALFDLFQHNAVNPKGGFHDLDAAGRPFGTIRHIHQTARMVHCYAIAVKLGRPGAATIVDHGMRYLWEGHRDTRYGGYCWSLDDEGFKDDSKQAYGHAFVLLAAADAAMIGHPLAKKLLADVTDVINIRFWDANYGAVSEEYARNWAKISDYRGQNSNMHLTEALMAAFEATHDAAYLDMAKSIARLIIGRHAKDLGYVVAEHFDEQWKIDRTYKGSDMFRPAGTTPGHWLEWSRLMAQLWVLDGRKEGWMIEAAEKLFRSAVSHGWDKTQGGFYYTLDFSNQPALTHKIWWPATEAIGAAAFLNALKPDRFYEDWYRKVWDFSALHFIDPATGGWFPELGEDLKPVDRFFTGKPDIYHALQACLIPLFPATGSLMKAVG
ncbi:AGE family epimerase/isomerase [Aestuariivirga litoralis]|uniref:AGE family epimerase/isomerase n=1 Tax=Aestuariivirga litoralis TaxID=2650924 RepID=A0A2W2AKZ6_9HYPH|nr:AGE family epimerase/isomerase [Aestuariivirga litoralis]PZF76041.1 AGE family epimerase/isomerase [Aestuariivirga litoralis]